ncbi:MAG: hypothetical protein HY816_19855 [Candidatus Wallbacteria bacterium]|nr:hypothetical protein [Candidatus Wallbacteria bacterium]
MQKNNRVSRWRQTARRLGEEHARLLALFLVADPVLRGTVYELRRRCGKPRCACASDGPPHSSWVLSWSERGRTRLRVVPAGSLVEWRLWTSRYQKLRKARARLVTLHTELLTILDALEQGRRREP